VIVDRDILVEVRGAFTEDRWKDLIRRFFDEAEETRIELLSLLRHDQIERIPAIAHRASGSAVSIGATALNDLFCEIESAAENPVNPERLETLIGALPECIARTAKAFE
jgi:HPt (histidine-containing phosphotransfer) domain-containing protein